MRNKFRVDWEIDDGYVGKSRPHSFDFDAEDLGDDLTDEDIADALDRAVIEECERTVTPYATNADEFKEWARGVLRERAK